MRAICPSSSSFFIRLPQTYFVYSTNYEVAHYTFSPIRRIFFPLRSKYFPQCPVVCIGEYVLACDSARPINFPTHWPNFMILDRMSIPVYFSDAVCMYATCLLAGFCWNDFFDPEDGANKTAGASNGYSSLHTVDYPWYCG
jgi:hypothetical protein